MMGEHAGITVYAVAGEYDGFSIKRIKGGLRVCFGWVAFGVVLADLESMVSRGSKLTVNRIMLQMHREGAAYCTQKFENCGAYGGETYTTVTTVGEERGRLLEQHVDENAGTKLRELTVTPEDTDE